jgi:hypothetical protein
MLVWINGPFGDLCLDRLRRLRTSLTHIRFD